MADKRYIVEKNVRLSQASVWKLQRDFYKEQGPEAWTSGTVPFWITNSSLLAKMYADLVVAWGMDAKRRGWIYPTQPIHVVEMAAGMGMLGYLIICHLLDTEHIWRPHGLDFKYVFTDIAKRNVDAWYKSPMFRPHIESGLVDVAVWSPLEENQIHLRKGRYTLSPGEVKTPMVAIGNYFLDSIPMDTFRVKEGKVLEGLLTATSSQPIKGPPTPEHLPDLEWKTEYSPCGRPYDNPVYDQILWYYAKNLEDAMVIFPVAAIKVMDRLAELGGGRALLLAADKGANHIDNVAGWAYDEPILHGGCFSFDANFDAMGRYLLQHGGTVLHNDPKAYLSISAFGVGVAEREVPSTRLAYQSHTGARDPSEFYRLMLAILEGEDPIAPDILASMLRQSAYDPYLIRRFQYRVKPQVSEADWRVKKRLRDAVHRTWKHYYWYGEQHDIPFYMGGLLLAAGYPAEARRFYERSIKWIDDHYLTRYNIGVTYMREDNWAEAAKALDISLEMEPTYEPAQRWRKKVEEYMAEE